MHPKHTNTIIKRVLKTHERTLLTAREALWSGAPLSTSQSAPPLGGGGDAESVGGTRWLRLIGVVSYAAVSAGWWLVPPVRAEESVVGVGVLGNENVVAVTGSENATRADAVLDVSNADWNERPTHVSLLLTIAFAWSSAACVFAVVAHAAAGGIGCKTTNSKLVLIADGVEMVVSWTLLATAAAAAALDTDDGGVACFVALHTLVACLAVTWIPPARRRGALIRSLLASSVAFIVAAGVAVYGALHTKRRHALGVVTIHALASACAAATWYVFDSTRAAVWSANGSTSSLGYSSAALSENSLPRYVSAAAAGGGGRSPPRETFETDARFVAQVASRMAVACAFWAQQMRKSLAQIRPNAHVLSTIPPETIEVLGPVACCAFFCIWILFSYPEKMQKPYYDGPVGSLLAAPSPRVTPLQHMLSLQSPPPAPATSVWTNDTSEHNGPSQSMSGRSADGSRNSNPKRYVTSSKKAGLSPWKVTSGGGFDGSTSSEPKTNVQALQDAHNVRERDAPHRQSSDSSSYLSASSPNFQFSL